MNRPQPPKCLSYTCTDLRGLEEQLKSAGVDTAHLELRWMLEELVPTGEWNRESLTSPQWKQLSNWIKRRIAGEPLAYILGHKYFYKYRFEVSPEVLIPRPETEQLLESALAWAKNRKALKLLDLGTGSGCLGLSFISEHPEAELVGIDISEGALAVAKSNAESLGLESRSHFMCADAGGVQLKELPQPFQMGVDLVMANPPYLADEDGQVQASVKKYEPDLALFAEDDGLAQLKAWARTGSEMLREGGVYLFEMGHDQAASMQSFLRQLHAFESFTCHQDYAGRDRWWVCKKGRG